MSHKVSHNYHTELFSINHSCNMLRTGSNTKIKMDFFDTFQYVLQQILNCGFEGLLNYQFYERHCCILVIAKCHYFHHLTWTMKSHELSKIWSEVIWRKRILCKISRRYFLHIILKLVSHLIYIKRLYRKIARKCRLSKLCGWSGLIFGLIQNKTILLSLVINMSYFWVSVLSKSFSHLIHLSTFNLFESAEWYHLRKGR